MNNTIIAGNSGTPISANDISGTVNTNNSHNNLIGNAATAGGLTDGTNGNIVGNSGSGTRDIRTILNTTLADNGGLTQTLALVPNSPAIDAGSNVLAIDPTTGRPLTTDQRGLPRIYNGRVDIGAFEAQPMLLVTNLNDDGPGSLRAAIAAADSDTTDDGIAFAGNLVRDSGPQTLTLTTGQLTLSKPQGRLSIASLGAPLLSISGNQASRVLQVTAGTDATISGLTITGGRDIEAGGVANAGTLTLISCTIDGNTSTNDGGGILSTGDLTIVDSTISNNTAFHAIGGIANDGGTVRIVGSTISGNRAGNFAGGIGNNAFMTITGSTVSGNTGPAGGIGNGGLLAIAGGTISDNTATGDGGGIFNIGGLALAGVTIRRNRAARGGGIANTNGGVLAIVASDISDNEGGDIVNVT